MNTKLTLASIAIIALLALSTATGAVVAQESGNQTTTGTSNETVSAQTEIELSQTTKVVGWRYANSTFEVDIRSTVPTRVTVIDAGALYSALTDGDASAAVSVRRRGYNVGTGETTIRFSARQVEGSSAITLAAVNGNRIGVLRSSGFGGGATYIAQSTAAALILAGVVGSGWFSYRRVKSRLEDEERGAERIL
jgi:hypothetical protein